MDRCAGWLSPTTGSWSGSRRRDIDLELYALYVRASQYGAGVGHRLIEAAIGDVPAYLWVFEANDRARGFYARHGFEPDGSRKPEPSFGEPEVRLRRG